MIYPHIRDLIGHTPVIKYKTIDDNEIFLKLEMFNPAGSVKDRIALQMIEDLYSRGLINEATPIVEATSGNTGIGLCFVLATYGLHPYIFLPENMSKERIDIMKAYGAKIILTPVSEGMSGATKRAEEFCQKNNGLYINQFMNESNVKAHEEHTSAEIIEDFPILDYVIAGIGTSGTITGLAKGMKKHYPNLKLIGVEPLESAVISGSPAGSHGIPGIGAGFMPPLFVKNLVDEIKKIATSDARKKVNELTLQGLFLGISSGAAILAAENLAKTVKNQKILVICPDGGAKYLSLGVYQHE